MSSNPIAPPPILPERAPLTSATLRRLFLTLFLRGRGARGLNRQNAPKSVGEKLALTLLFYLLFGALAASFLRQPVFALSVYLHAMTFMFLGMFVASSSGELLFNREEADILMHRPIDPRTMLWAKIRVLIEVSLWIAGAFNLIGLVVGFFSGGGWRYPVVHMLSVSLEALFCTSCVVLAYQLCLRWFGRERLDGLMTMAQVIVSITVVLSSQILPRLVFRYGSFLGVDQTVWWINLLPPAWFAGLDDAVAGSGRPGSWLLAALALVFTAVLVWSAFGRLAGGYDAGMQILNETVSSRPQKAGGRRWLDTLVESPPFCWWLRDSVERASFLLTTAYLARDRDVKLRLYPGIAPVLIIPFAFLLQNHRGEGSAAFGIALSGSYLSLVPSMGLQLLQFSQQWQAADIFRAAPLPGPAAICHGARRAVLCFLTLPMVVLVFGVVWLLAGSADQLLLLLPGIILLPVVSLLPNLGGRAVLLSRPADAAKSAGRGLRFFLVTIAAFMLAGLAAWSWSRGWFYWLLAGEAVVAVGLYGVMRHFLSRTRWPLAD